MNYPYNLALNLASTIFMVLIGASIYSSVIRRKNRIGERHSIRMIILFLAFSVALYFLYPYPLFQYFDFEFPPVADFLLYISISFFLFFILAKKELLISFKETAIFYLLAVFLIFPLMGGLNTSLIRAVNYLEPFRSERVEMEEEFYSYIKENQERPTKTDSLPLRRAQELQSALFNWPIERSLDLIADMQGEKIKSDN